MPPNLLPPSPEEITDDAPRTRLTSSRKWLGQVALLFGLLGIGYRSRHVPPSVPAPRWPPEAPAATRSVPMPVRTSQPLPRTAMVLSRQALPFPARLTSP